MDDVKYIAHMFEEIRSQNKAVLEAVGDMQQKVALLPAMQQDIAELKQDVKTIKAAVGDLSRDLANHVRQPSHEGGVVKTGKHVFICGRCADERYGAGQDTGC